jgi:hypothetical protein
MNLFQAGSSKLKHGSLVYKSPLLTQLLHAVAIFLGSALVRGIHPLILFKMENIQGVNASCKRTG